MVMDIVGNGRWEAGYLYPAAYMECRGSTKCAVILLSESECRVLSA